MAASCPTPCCSTAACSAPTRWRSAWPTRWRTGAARRCACCTTTIPTWPWRAARSPTRWRDAARRRASAAARRAAISCVLGEAGKDHRAVCILPRGSASGEEIRLTERLFALRLGRPGALPPGHVASAEAGTPPQLGELVDLDDGDYLRLPPLASVLHAQRRQRQARNHRAAGHRDDRSGHAGSALRGRRRCRPALAAGIPAARWRGRAGDGEAQAVVATHQGSDREDRAHLRRQGAKGRDQGSAPAAPASGTGPGRPRALGYAAAAPAVRCAAGARARPAPLRRA